MDFFKRSDYQRVFLYIVTSMSVLLMLKYLLPYFLPLLLALLVVVPLQRFCQRREQAICEAGKKRHVPGNNGKGFMAGGILFGLILLVALMIVGIGTFLVAKTRDVVQDMGFWTDSLSCLVEEVSSAVENFFGIEDGTVKRWVSGMAGELGKNLAASGNGLLTGSLKSLSVAGRLGTFVIVSFICVVLFAREVEGWQQGLLTLAALEPAIDRILSVILRIGKKLGSMIKTYIRTQSIILLCISVVAVTGLYLGGIKEGWFYGILAGIMDFLPFIGTGIVLIPIGVVSFLRGKIAGGIVIVITYFICVLARELLEPRLLGNGLKFSPVAILLSVYAGVMYYGIGGVILGPISLMVLVELGKEIFLRNR